MAADAPDRSRFRFWARDTVRFGDTDRQGHVNNAVYATFSETGRVAFLYDPADPLGPPGTEFVIARMVIDFRAEAGWPGDVDIGTAVVSVGRSSFRLEQGIWQGDKLVATTENVIVLMDSATRRSTPLPDAARARLEAAMPAAEEG
jgi:acyl-CoA thioester hydrolase